MPPYSLEAATDETLPLLSFPFFSIFLADIKLLLETSDIIENTLREADLNPFRYHWRW